MTLTPLSAPLQHVGQRRAVDGGDHQDLGALGDHVLDLGELVGNVVFGVLQIGRVAGFLEHLTMFSPSEIQRAEDLVGMEMPMSPLSWANILGEGG
jgi:hypothetical protein